MAGWSKTRSLASVAAGAVGGVAVYFAMNWQRSKTVSNSWTTNTVVPPEAKWDTNWDQ